MKPKYLLVLILILAGALRLLGTYPGYHSNHADEVNIYSTAASMIKNNNFEPFRYEYPPLPAYINLVVYKVFFIPAMAFKFYLANLNKVFDGVISLNPTKLEFNKIFQVEILGEREINVLFWSRAITALFGVGVVFLAYKVAKDVFGEKVGLISAFLVAINFRQVLNSHFGLPDIYNAFFLLLAFWFTLKVYKNPTRKNYLLASVSCGLAFCIKYQFFSFLPFALVHLMQVIKGKKALFDPAAIAVPFVILSVFLFFNAHFFIHLEQALTELVTVTQKYRAGKNSLDFYPLSYLYHYGIGPISSIAIVLGLSLALIKINQKIFLVLSLVGLFFFFTIFYTGGGFYTRNFVTITPFVLIFAAFLIGQVFKLNSKYLKIFLVMGVVLVFGWESLRNDLPVITRYRQAWNKDKFMSWVTTGIPKGAKIAAHSSVPLPDYYFERLPNDFYPAFSVEEFKEEGANYAVASLEWATNDFYGWMTQNTRESLRYWNRPIEALRETYPALAVSEMEDFGVYGLVNPWQAPDSDFLAVKLPDYKVDKKEVVKTYDFEKGEEGWTKMGDGMEWRDGALTFKRGGVAALFSRWESPFLDLKNMHGREVDYEMKTIEDGQKPDGFVLVSFYDSDRNRMAVRLSKRNNVYNQWVEGKLVTEIPEKAKYVKIGFQVYNSAIAGVYLDKLTVYNAEVLNLNKDGVKHIDIDENVLFPVSHGNL